MMNSLLKCECKSMGNRLQIERFCNSRSQRLLYVVAGIIVLAILSQFLVIPYENYALISSNVTVMFMRVNNPGLSSNESQPTNTDILHENADSGSDEESLRNSKKEGKHKGSNFFPENGGQLGALSEDERRLPTELKSGKELAPDKPAEYSSALQEGLENELEFSQQTTTFKANDTKGLTVDTNLTKEGRSSVDFPSPKPLTTHSEFIREVPNTSEPYGDDLLQPGSVSSSYRSATPGETVLKKSRRPTSISYMKTLLHQYSPPSNSMRPQPLSARDEELLNARLQIESAPIIRNVPNTYASLFRNYSMFIRSYELMECVLRVYIYKEGQKPIFHQPHLRGIYASEGWFMKQMEGNKRFVVRNPRKAHLFYLPFSSRRLRSVLHQQNFTTHRDLENHLKNYVTIIAAKYNFWNRTKGADHFLVACHDWALGFTRKSMQSCIRAVCNSNIAKGFVIGKDVSLPVTTVASAEKPVEDLGGSHPSKRHILAFFAGSMHGNLRPILLRHWNNKESDMKIFGPMGHDAKALARYREFMKNSKFCICAKGYEVHTPRVIESIYYECVPVIISDNYVPPLFEIFEWESFSVFVLEEDVPNLRNILLSIPEDKYIEMQNRVKMVQKHFLWHKTSVKYDLFHMILHSIWYNRVFQVKS